MAKSWKQSMLLFSLYFLNVFLQVLLATNSVSSKQHVRCHDDESLALIQFKQSFSINKSASGEPYAYAKVASWKKNGSRSDDTNDCCSWDGVACSEDTGHVIGLDLSSSFLYGPINSSSSLFLLVHLQNLNLSDNNFRLSQIPSGIASLSDLTSLDLSSSAFSGEIPKEISQLTQLASLDLYGNTLQLQSLSFEHLVQNFKMLKELSLSSVNISSQIPHSLANLTSLRFLALKDCALTGEFPSSIFHLPELQHLSVRFNEKLTGSLPKFHPASRLEHLRLAGTNFSGRLPDSIGNLKSLLTLDLNNCSFSGSLPVSIGKLKSLVTLDLGECSFSGSLPASLGNLTEITLLDLSDNGFKGQIPSLETLSELRSILLFDNQFDAGILPNWFGKLAKLTYIDLSNTNLHGVMPSSFSNLSQLTNIYLSSNHINDQIPSSLMNLTQLSEISFFRNSLHGPIPASFSQLEHITNLNLYGNKLSGIVEADVFLNLKKLKILQLSKNTITFLDTENHTNANLPQFQIIGLSSSNMKMFPYFLRNQNELELVSLSSNHIPGQIPEWFWNCSKETLEVVDLHDNLLTGFENYPRTLPWAGVRFLDLGHNMLQGLLPLPPPNTMVYLVQENRLSGEIPPMICQVSSLHTLDLSNNNMTGIIPPCLGNQIISLSILMLKDNNFRGTIPNSFMKGSKLKLIDISGNQLEGQLPRSLANCSLLQSVNIANNSVYDNFPFWLGILSDLRILILRSNKFHGEIKSSLAINSDQFPKLRILDLSDNYFKGGLPQDYMMRSWTAMKIKISGYNASYLQEFITIQLQNRFMSTGDFNYSMSITNRGAKREYEKILNVLSVLDLSSNKFVGEIPAAIGQLQGLQLLDLSNNNLTGGIPSSFLNLTNLESLDLSRNRLSGKIPPQLVQLTFLAFLNVSQNNLDGPIPRGEQFSTFENTSYEGNLGLCGAPLSKICGISQVPRIVPKNEEADESLLPTNAVDWIIIFLGLASGLVVGLVFGQYLTSKYPDWFERKFGEKKHLI